MRVKFTVILIFLFHLSALAQSRWETTKVYGKESFNSAPLLWQYKDKVFLYADKSGVEIFKEQGDDHMFVGSADEKSNPVIRIDALKWVTDQGLWLFGGVSSTSNELLNDLWFYSFKASKWQKIEVKGKIPGPRRGAGGWIDEKQNLYLFGGYLDSPLTERSGNFSNEIWCFNTLENEWIDKSNINSPSARVDMAIWSPNPAEIYLYGGFGYDKDYKGSRVLADFWRYNSTRGEWEEMSKESHSIERVLGEGGKIIYPGYRVKAKHWIDGDGNLWLAFGQSIISSEKISIEPFIWKYDTKKGIWSYTYVANDPIIESAELIWMPLGNRIEMIFPNSLNKDFRFSVKPELLQLNLKN